MPHEGWMGRRVVAELSRLPLLGGSVVAFLLIAAFRVAVGAMLGLQSVRDVGYPDSATLLRVGELVHTGHIYPAFDRPPYLATLYGPLMYVLLGIPYALAEAVGIDPRTAVRLAVLGSLCLCFLFIFLIGKRLYRSSVVAWLCVLFAVSILPLANWSTQIRGDFLALGFSLVSVYLFLFASGRRNLMGAAVCAAVALLVKQTFIAAPLTMIFWLIYKRQYKEAAFCGGGIALIVACGYAILLWREPLMLKHIHVLQHPALEYRDALRFAGYAVWSQPVVPFAALGGLFILGKGATEMVPLVVFCVVAWMVAVLTIPQVGGGINYFWEPLVGSAALAGLGLRELQRKWSRTPVVVTGILVVLLCLLSMMRDDVGHLEKSYQEMKTYQVRKAEWESFVSIVSGRRLLSTFPDVTIHSRSPEIPDPILNSMLERQGMWDSAPVVAEIHAGRYDLIVIRNREAYTHETHRGIQRWSNRIWTAVKEMYQPACVFEDIEVWLPRRDADEVRRRLSAMGCLGAANTVDDVSGLGR